MNLRLGGVAENVNLPWYELVRRQPIPGVSLSWEVYHGGTGAMVAALEADEVDVVVALTEGIVAAVGRGADVRLAGSFTASGLTWGVHTPADAPWTSFDELQGKRFAISRPGSGSHIMSFVEAKRRGWDLSAMSFVEVGDLDGARVAFQEGRADAFLWEKFTTKHLVDAGAWKCVDVCLTPWPAFSVAASGRVLATQPERVRQVVAAIQEIVRSLQADPTALIANIAQTFDLQEADVRAWLSGNQWAPGVSFSHAALTDVIETLVDVEVLKPDQLRPSQVTWSECPLR